MFLNDRVIPQPHAKVLGGCSGHNAMLYVRGARADYDGWAALGCQGWDWQLAAYIKAEASTSFHACGTCAMGTDEWAVMDPALRVRGVTGLRVVDASIMPVIVSGNTAAATMMIADKATSMILADRAAGTARPG